MLDHMCKPIRPIGSHLAPQKPRRNVRGKHRLRLDGPKPDQIGPTRWANLAPDGGCGVRRVSGQRFEGRKVEQNVSLPL
jgi:hypothetical protein